MATERLTAAGLNFTRADVFVTPRRLALVVDGLPARTPDLKEEKKGPRVGSPDQAIQGFLKGAGLASLDTCEKRMVGKAEFWFAIVEKKGQATADLLPGLIADTVKAFGWPKSMRWGANRFAWVRPLQSVLAQFDGKTLSGGLDIGGSTIAFGDTTSGHRFLAPARFAVTSFADYQSKLLVAKVLLDPAKRRAKILADLEAKAKALGLTLRDDPGLLDEVTGLVEWPVVLTGAIDAKFMDVPQEALITSMRAHQKYFALLNADGSLARQFALVANMETDDAGATIVAGNERVLRARLSRRQILLGFGSQDEARGSFARFGAARVPRQARHDGAEGRTPRKAFGVHRDEARRRCGCRVACGEARQGRPFVRHGRRIPRAARHHGPLLRAARRRNGRDRRRDPRTLPAAGPVRCVPVRTRLGRGGAGRETRHARRLLVDRREADRLEGSVRAAPFGLGRDPPDRREQAALGLARGVRRGLRRLRCCEARTRRRSDGVLRRPF